MQCRQFDIAKKTESGASDGHGDESDDPKGEHGCAKDLK